MAFLKIDNLNVHYGAIHALKGVSVEVNKGEIVTLIGSNGAGKTTTMYTAAGILKPSAGKIIFEDEDITKLDAPEVVRRGICLSPEGRQVFPELTVRENLDLGAFLRTTKERDEMLEIVKVSYNGYLMPEAFGAEIKWSPDFNTFPTMLKHNVNHPAEWPLLKPASVKSGAFKREIDATARLVEHFKGEVPILPTIFSPLTAAQEMSCGWLNPWPIMADMKYSANELHQGLEIIAESTNRFLEELIKVGVDGVFFATQLACYNRTTKDQYDEFGSKYDLALLDSIKDKTWFNMVHIHGAEELFFTEIEHYPVQAFNWEDLNSNISLKFAREHSDKILCAGIEHIHDFHEADRDALKDKLRARVKTAIADAGRDKLIIGPGCVVPTDVPEYRLTVLKEVVEELG